MFKTLLALVLVANIGVSVSAQSSIMSNLRFGFQASFLSFSWFSTDEATVASAGSALWGMKLGVLGEKSFADNYSFTFGLGFQFNTGGRLLFEDESRIWTGSTYAGNATTFGPKARAKYNLQFLEIPLGLKMRTAEFGRIRYFAEPSVAIAICTQARGTVEADVTHEQINISSATAGAMLSWGVGAGAEYNISGNTAFVAGIYYSRGFTDVTTGGGTSYKFNNQWVTESSKAVINNFTIRTAIMF